jgi:hypothetical protein
MVMVLGTRAPAQPLSVRSTVKPLAVVVERMAARAECQASTEVVYLVVAVALAEPGRHYYLMRPAAINCHRRELAFATHARTAA